ncbi:hypothetical protein Tco_0779228 [Tanacetum coccineum]
MGSLGLVWEGSAISYSGKASKFTTIFSWGDSISPDGFLPSILFFVVIIVAVVIVVVTVVLVVVIGEGSSIIKLSVWNHWFLHSEIIAFDADLLNFGLW